MIADAFIILSQNGFGFYSEVSQRCRTEAAEEALEKATLLHYEAERGKRLLERDKEEKEKECEIWIKKYKGLADLLHSQEEQKSKRQDKSVCISEISWAKYILKFLSKMSGFELGA